MQVDYRILGRLEIARGGVPILVTAAKERELLVYLLLHPDEALSVDRLIEALWGEQAPRSAVKLLQLYVSNLRKVLGRQAIATSAGGYRMDLGPEALDSLRFGAIVREAREARAEGSNRRAAALFGRALSLWRGSEIADGAVSEAARLEAGRLEEARVECAEERLETIVLLGGHHEALSELVVLSATYPLREHVRAQLMLALYRSGRQADALDVFRDLSRTLDEQLGLEPGEELRALERSILRHDPDLTLAPSPQPVSRLPAPPTELIGRGRELVELRVLLEGRGTRLLSLVGAGGSGKTRLAIALASVSSDLFMDGVILVELAAIREPERVGNAIAAALDVAAVADEPVERTVVEAIAGRELLLVVDNFEQVTEAGPFLVELLAGAPRLTIIVTSRRVLHLSGEHVYPVQPLPEDDAVALFVARASAIEPSIGDHAGARDEVLTICRRLDRLPLAIELAAAWARLLTPGQLLERLNATLTLLTGGPRDMPARQQTLRDTLAWSVGLLETNERRRLADLSIFSGGCSLEAALDIAGADLDSLSALVDHSLLGRETTGNEPRFQMLETIREYAGELLGTRRTKLESVHALYFAALVEQAELTGASQPAWLFRLDRERDNLRAALDHAARAPDPTLELRLAGGLWRFWWLRGELAEGRSRLEHALARGGGCDVDVLGPVWRGAAGIAWNQGDAVRARELATLGVESSEDDTIVLACHTVLGLIARDDNDYARARRHLEQSAAVAASLGRESDVNVARMNLGSVAFNAGEFADAQALWQEVLSYNRKHGSDEGVAIGSLNLGIAAFRLGDPAEARTRFTEARTLFDRLGFHEHHAHALQGLAAVEVTDGRAQQTARLLGEAARLLAQTGSAATTFDAELPLDAETKARSLLGDKAFAEAFAGETTTVR